MFPNDGPAYSVCETASWHCRDEGERSQALEAVEFALRPAPEDDLGAALYTLRIMTRGREAASEGDRQAEAIIWLQHLRKFPADIALTTLRNWPTRPNGMWWPTWHEVQRELEALTSSRRMLAQHIRSGACLPAPATEDREALTEEDRARREQMAARLKSQWGSKPEPVEPGEDFDAWEQRVRGTLATNPPRLSKEVLSHFNVRARDEEAA